MSFAVKYSGRFMGAVGLMPLVGGAAFCIAQPKIKVKSLWYEIRHSGGGVELANGNASDHLGRLEDSMKHAMSFYAMYRRHGDQPNINFYATIARSNHGFSRKESYRTSIDLSGTDKAKLDAQIAEANKKIACIKECPTVALFKKCVAEESTNS